MTRTAPKGWLVAALVLAVALLVASIAMVAMDGGRSGSRESQEAPWMSGRPGSTMMGNADRDDASSRGHESVYEDCQDLMRGRAGR